MYSGILLDKPKVLEHNPIAVISEEIFFYMAPCLLYEGLFDTFAVDYEQ